MRIILIGNYPPDNQESMERFAKMLEAGFQDEGYSCEIWRPRVFFGGLFTATNHGLGKWMGYIDKWLIFPVLLKWRTWKIGSAINSFSFQICDHSNAPYLKFLPLERTVITCHDVLAIMGALGYKDTFCEASKTGKILQQWILKYLSSANKLAAVSRQTLLQLRQISVSKKGDVKNNWHVIYNGFNEHFEPSRNQTDFEIIKKSGLDTNIPFLLHVGSGLPRKNRKLLIEMLALLKETWPGNICFAGEKLDDTLIEYATSLGVEKRIVNVIKPGHAVLNALYSNCEAFIFPSFSEGFGWPVIEAQACGAPVIASNIQPMPEISGGAALHYDPNNVADFANGFTWLQDKSNRTYLIKKGFENIKRFDTKQITKSYLELHGA